MSMDLLLEKAGKRNESRVAEAETPHKHKKDYNHDKRTRLGSVEMMQDCAGRTTHPSSSDPSPQHHTINS
ncbi:unnamed protein product [Gadus morhua 'NCC']